MAKLGILGGGQLALMTAQAAITMGIETVIFAPKPDTPASRITPHNLVGAWDDEALLKQFTDLCDVVTLESEFVGVEILQRIEALGTPVYASSQTLAQVQDKLTQKRRMQSVDISVPRFRPVQVATDVLAAVEEYGFPLMLKARRNGYDGYGNVVINRAPEIQPALDKLAGRKLMVEEMVNFVRELAVIVVRDRDGNMKNYPVVETIQQDNVCHRVLCPARVEESTAYKATQMAVKAVEAINGVGVFGVEMFEVGSSAPTRNGSADNEVIYNEIAPRPHNSGHYTIEGSITSQFENHVRAVMGLPLGDVAQIAPATAMINILGERENEPDPMETLRGALAVEGVHVHWYGKRQQRPRRKMGHITALGYDQDTADKICRYALSQVQL